LEEGSGSTIHSFSFFVRCVCVYCVVGDSITSPVSLLARYSPLRTKSRPLDPKEGGWLCPEEWRHHVAGRKGSISQRGCLSLALFFADINHPSPPPRPPQVRGLGLVPGETSWFLFYSVGLGGVRGNPAPDRPWLSLTLAPNTCEWERCHTKFDKPGCTWMSFPRRWERGRHGLHLETGLYAALGKQFVQQTQTSCWKDGKIPKPARSRGQERM